MVDAGGIEGECAGESSPARHDTPLLGLDLEAARGRSTVPVRRDFEHALVVLDGAVDVDGVTVEPGQLCYLGGGREEVALTVADTARLLVLGGEPFTEPILMWWNFVARTRDEMATAYRDWQEHSPRFPAVTSSLTRIDAPVPYWSQT